MHDGVHNNWYEYRPALDCMVYMCILTYFLSRYRGQLAQEVTDGNFMIVRGLKYWNTWTARLAFVIVFEVSQLLFLSRAHRNGRGKLKYIPFLFDSTKCPVPFLQNILFLRKKTIAESAIIGFERNG